MAQKGAETRIVACLIWYDEHPDDLRDTCLSLAGFASGMVALDGAFHTFPHLAPWSPPEQWEALAQACAEAEIELLAYLPTRAGAWPGERGDEVEKRNASLYLAGLLQPDWVVAVDADMRLMPDWEEALPLLAQTDRRVAETLTAGWPLRNMFRWTPTLRYVGSHYSLVDGDDLIAWPSVFEAGSGQTTSTARDNPQGQKQQLSALDLSGYVVLAHEERRDQGRRRLQDSWYETRDALGLEGIPPGF